MNMNNAQPVHLAQQQHGQQPAQPPASAGPTQHGHGQRPAQQVQSPAQQVQSPAQQQARPASAQPDQRPARALRTITGLALLALAAFITITGRAPC